MKKKHKAISFSVLIIGILSLVFIIAGVSYAWFTWTSDKTSLDSQTGCFNINYTGSFTNTNMIMSSDYTGGLLATVSMAVSDSCDIKSGIGSIKLNTVSFSSNEVSLIDVGALKYTVLYNDAIVSTGIVDTVGDIELLSNIDLDITEKDYKIYLWVDGNIADNSFSNAIYDGHVYGEVTQTH